MSNRQCQPLQNPAFMWLRMASKHLALPCRFLAEVPDAFSQRVQKLLPMLMTVHGGEGVPFLLPALLQVLDGESLGTEGQGGWVTALLQQQVRLSCTSVSCCPFKDPFAWSTAAECCLKHWHTLSICISVCLIEQLRVCEMLCFQADPVRAMYRHAGGAASRAAMGIERANNQAGPASHTADGEASQAITARERDLLITCEVLLGMFKAT